MLTPHPIDFTLIIIHSFAQFTSISDPVLVLLLCIVHLSTNKHQLCITLVSFVHIVVYMTTMVRQVIA